MTKAMILGAGGWLGARLASRLVRDGRGVICVDVHLGGETRALAGAEFIEANISDIAKLAPRLAECDVVFNCAGLLHPKATGDIYRVNRDAPLLLYRACVEHGVKTFVHVSSITAHGANADGTRFLDETLPLQPITHYGHSKAEAEVALVSALSAATRLIILRPGVFYGDQPSKNLQEFMTKLRTSAMPIFADRGMVRTYVDVDKVIDAMILAEHKGRSGEAYLIGDDEPLCTLRFYQIIAGEFGCVPRVLRAPLFVARACEKIAFAAGRLGLHLRIPTIVGEFGRHTFAGNSKAIRELGFVPHPSSEPGLRRMANSTK